MSAAKAAPPRVQRVTLAVRQPAPDLLGAAAALARDLQAQLAALFVEDLTLLRVAALPVTREIGRVSGVARSFDLPDLERMLRRQAQQLHDQLATAAQTSRLAWSFEVRRGDLLEQALRLLAPEQAVLLGHRQESGRPQFEEHTQLTVVLDAGHIDLAALHFALRVAHGGTVSVLLAGPPDALPALRAQIDRELGSVGAAGRIEFLTGQPIALLARPGAGLRSRALVLSGALVRADRQALKALAEATTAPLILVG